jgi:uncharacterized lipoprotein YddW (UPF0748 family)
MRFSKKNICCLAYLILVMAFFTSCTKKIETEPEIRAVWLHPGLFSSDVNKAAGQMDSLFTLYQDIGINNLFCYNTTTGENSFGWDYLDMLIRVGHKKGIKIHPIFYPGYSVNIEKELADHPSWLIRDMDGKYQPHFNLANPEVRKYWVDRISAALKYDIDGIHLDYIRVPLEQVYSYDSLTCEAFRKIYQYSPADVSHDCGSMIWCEWIKWNAGQVTKLVEEIRQAIKESGKPVVLGADVFPDAGTSGVLIAQEWGNWANAGLIDFICPMLYTNNLELFKEYLTDALDAADGKCKVYPGIGVHTSHNDITKELIIKEVNITREQKTSGMAFFSGYSFNKEFRDTLKVSLFKHI